MKIKNFNKLYLIIMAIALAFSITLSTIFVNQNDCEKSIADNTNKSQTDIMILSDCIEGNEDWEIVQKPIIGN